MKTPIVINLFGAPGKTLEEAKNRANKIIPI